MNHIKRRLKKPAHIHRGASVRDNKLLRYLVFSALLALACLVFVPQLGSFGELAGALVEAHLGWFILGAVAMFLAPVCAATVYHQIVLRPVPYRQFLLAQCANLFVNRLLPAGIGGMGLMAAFLHKKRFSAHQITAMISLNGMIGFLGHLLVVLAVVLTVGIDFRVGNISYEIILWICLLLGIAVVLLIVLSPGLRRSVLGFLRQTGRILVAYRKRPLRIFFALLAAIGVTLVHVLMLWAATKAVDVGLGFGALIVILSGGILATSSSPTPGGLGGSEAGFTALLMLYGVAAPAALAAALLYRLMNYWIPILPGIVGFAIARSRRYI